MDTSEKAVALTGSESALVVAALFALAEWPFTNAKAKSLIGTDKSAGERLSEVLSARWIRLLEGAGLWNRGSAWTPELIASRAALRPALTLDATEIPLAAAALEAVNEEFSGDWDEFCTVAPGALQWYPLGPQDVPALAGRLKAVLPG
ncbi:hypothetical protein [Sorangium sp. So ce887]|uniref:hypothetical protein n=1 Tax=Sorangium sp. So ce887 TaxID=3133324 RepID=UPI003F63D57A